ncbi:short-chain dehydrogenase [Acidovorax sp.]|uniref:short-chain dehydrogenase n=1 Tax=Acidovorax sp. TaxID=1872122 RepID=UPI002ACE4365|nr:short-chain dehydrogenase [Acidovorax sp.]MDZ7864458.1 short-chain dehydrogenase [Acidovorax sp.]
MATPIQITFGARQRRRPGLIAGWVARLALVRARAQRGASAAAAARRLEHLDLDQRVREVGEW